MNDIESRIRLLNLYTQNKKLPDNRITENDLNLVQQIISRTFESVKNSTEYYSTIGEEKLNTLMEMHFTDLIENDDEISMKIVSVLGEPRSMNFNATSFRLRPDFRVKMYGANKRRLFVTIESKIIDETKVSIKAYCDEGINRFLIGNYAWDVTKAIMIAYMRDDSTIRTKLTTHLQEGNPPNSVKFAVKEMPTVVSEVKGDVSYTVHDRKFKYIHRPKSERPGPITLWHIGLKLI